MKEELTSKITEVIEKILSKAGINDAPLFSLVIPDNPEHGDFATNVAMQLSKSLKRNPKSIAEEIIEAVVKNLDGVTAEIAGPGFINFKLSKQYYYDILTQVLADDNFFTSKLGKGKKVLVEFVSANPTGPLHIGHGRGAAYGDSLARVMAAAGFDVSREYYINDGGNQMFNLGKSVYVRILEKAGREFVFPENGYHGDYIKDIAIETERKHPKILDMAEDEAVKICLDEAINTIGAYIKGDLEEFRVSFDTWFSEKTLYKSGAVDKTLEKLAKSGATYEKDGALWFATERLGDDKDRVLKKNNGEFTYFTPDIAYHENKYSRGFDRLIDVWGADHHGYIKRMACAVEALGHNPNSFEVTLIQMVNLIKDKQKISMSTRSGSFIPLSWLIDEVGLDAARFFYNMRSHDAQFDFDIDLAKSHSSDNPVYYIQYAHARVFSLLSNAKDKGHEYKRGENLDRLKENAEIDIIKNIIKLRYIIELAATHLEPHRVAYHLQELAAIFHNYYYANPIITGDKELTNARLTLSEALAKTIKYGLSLLGVSAPERM